MLGLACFAKTADEEVLFATPETVPTEDPAQDANDAPHRLSVGIIAAIVLAVLIVAFAAVFTVAKVRKAKRKTTAA